MLSHVCMSPHASAISFHSRKLENYYQPVRYGIYLKKYYMLWEQERVNNVTHRKLCQERDTGVGAAWTLQISKAWFRDKSRPWVPWQQLAQSYVSESSLVLILWMTFINSLIQGSQYTVIPRFTGPRFTVSLDITCLFVFPR